MAGEANQLSLGDLVTLTRGTTYKSALLGQPGPVLLGLASIKRNGGFRDDNLKTYGGECPAKLTLRPGDIFVSLKDVTQAAELLGSIARVPPHIPAGRVTQDTVKLTFTRDDIPSRYVYWLLRTPVYREYCRAHAIGTTNLALPREDFLAFPIPRPKEREMTLVDVLDALDDKIELNRRMNATLEAMARALFQSWFVDFDPVRAKLDGRPPAALFPASFDETELGHIPHGWEVKTLGEVIELAYGKPLKAEDRKNGPVCVYGANGPVGWHDEKLVSGPGIVVGRKGNPGVVTWAHGDFYPIDTTFYVEPKGACRSLYFFYYALSLHNLANLSADSAVPGLNRNHAYMSKQVIPSQPVLTAFDSQIAPIFASIHANEEQSRTLATLRDTLLPKLLSGELSVGQTPI